MIENGTNKVKSKERHANNNDDVKNECNQKRRLFGSLIRQIYSANGGPVPAEILKPFDSLTFKDICEYLGEDILTVELLQIKLQELFEVRHSLLKEAFKHDTRCMLIVAPVTETGRDLSDDAILNDNYFQNLSVLEDGTTLHFSFRPGPYAAVFPEGMQNECSFKVEWKADEKGETANIVTSEEFVRFHNSYVDSYNNLRQFLSLDPLDTSNLYISEEDYRVKCGFKGSPGSN